MQEMKVGHVEANSSLDVACYIQDAAKRFALKSYEVRERMDYYKTLELVLRTEDDKEITPTLFVTKNERNRKLIEAWFKHCIGGRRRLPLKEGA